MNKQEATDVIRLCVAEILDVCPSSVDDAGRLSLDSVQRIVLIVKLETIFGVEILSPSPEMFDSIEILAASLHHLRH